MKQVIAVRKDLDMSKGKMAAQVAHASLGAYRATDQGTLEGWRRSGEKKVVVWAGDEEDMFEIKENAENLGLPTYLVSDAGRTEIPKGTKTALAIGPGKEEKIDRVTAHLPLVD